jgi:hypothetical protein
MEMMTRTWLPAQNPQFDEFLFAPVGEDANGMRVSVLSALARLGVDPWQEAQDLAALPTESAGQRLDTLIAVLPDVPALRQDHRAVATRLIALLPRAVSGRIEPGTTATDAGQATRTGSFVFGAFLIFLLVGQVLMHIHPQVTAGAGAKAPITAVAPTR